MKSPNITSKIGREPLMAAPTAMPKAPASEIGVSITRSLPNASNSPSVCLNTPPAAATSSPIISTLSSRRISANSASRTAAR